MIHPEYGLWHVYRAAMLFAERIALRDRKFEPSPCEDCAKKPCLRVCPADAFLPDRFDGASCVTHVTSENGSNCRECGCLARRACPVGRDYAYPREAQAFHTAAFVRSARKIFSV
jgi:Fe-S-cluster-containing hydrogenase component 2